MVNPDTHTADRIAEIRDRLVQSAAARASARGATPAPSAVGSPERRRARHVDALIAALRGAGAPELQEYAAWSAAFREGFGEPRTGIEAELEELADDLRAAPSIAPAQRDRALGLIGAAQARLHTDPLVTPVEIAAIPGTRPTAEGPAAAIRRAKERIGKLATALAYARRPADAITHGRRRSLALEDAGHHLDQLIAALEASEPGVFADYAAWVQVLLTTRGLHADELPSALGALDDVIELTLGAARAAPARRCVSLALERLRGDVSIPSFIDPAAPLGSLARGYLDAVLSGARTDALGLITGAAAVGTRVQDLYANVLRPSQYEVGRLWQVREISVAREHFCSAVTQVAMGMLFPRVLGAPRVGRRAVVASVPGNLHEIGARFVADYFEMAGWDSFYLGASAPPGDVIREAVARRADVLALSATLYDQLASTREILAAARADPGCRDVLLLVGGHPFRAVTDLWRSIGADGSARDAEEVVPLAERLCAVRDARGQARPAA